MIKKEKPAKHAPKSSVGKTLGDRVVLERLIQQILPTLILENHRKADDILAFVANPAASLEGFLSRYPEYQNFNSELTPAEKKTLSFVDGQEDYSVGEIVDFNHPIFYHLEDELRARSIINSNRSDLSFRFQLRSALYKNFNHYLSLVLSLASEKNLASVIKKISSAKNVSEFIQALEGATDKSGAQIIEHFLNLAKTK